MRNKRGPLWLSAVAVFAADRAAKILAQRTLTDGPRAALPGVLRFAYTENTGIAFGMLPGSRLFVLPLTGAALAGLLIFLLLRGNRRPALETGALWALLGGALGNFYDRLFLGYVVDFLQIPWFHFPVFNLADVAVCAAFALLAWCVLTAKEKPHGP